MKKLKTIFGLSLSIFMFCSCVSNEVSPNTGGAREPDKIIEREESYVDDVRRASGFTDEEALELMLMEDCCHTTRIGSSNIILGIPTEITFGEDLKGRLAGDWGEIIFVDYLFKITDNLTGNSLPEYITVSSQIGDIFELGKEYCINPSHNNSTLWDSHLISGLNQVISSELLSDSDFDRIRQSGEKWRKQFPDVETVVEKASLTLKFISNVDLTIEVTIVNKQKDLRSGTIYDITYKLNDIIYLNDLYEDLRPNLLREEEEGLYSMRINSDVEVGETYIIMLEVHDDGSGGGFTMPASREGAVVSVKSSDYAKYEKTFLDLNKGIISNNEYKMVIEVEPNNVNLNEIPEFIKIAIHNLTDGIEYRGGYHYEIEYFNAENWKRMDLSLISGIELVFPDMELVIESGEIVEMDITMIFKNDSYNFTVGKYRIKYDEWYGEFFISQ